ncbi:transglutaminase-like domain-containing protein [Dyella choica]|uniref:Transglutaminase domain-containing protein n=1 Tax=Dyella choica TaxID=1927959 RepID=A0A432MBA5_9GAMM|nr:transglutaminase domain-containing protein [Dyella choica]RUL80021.1 transglutaminase domain-containing protein [Dyella choica]
MRSRFAPLLLVPMLCLAPSQVKAAADAASVDTTWMTVLLNGRKIGHEEIRREQRGNTVTTTQTLVMSIERNQKVVPYINVSRSVETAAGEPVDFTMTSTMSATETKVEGSRLPDGRLELVNTVGGQTRRSIVTWPAGAVLVEGQRKAMQAAAAHPGTDYRLLTYNQASQQAIDLSVTVIGNERVQLVDHAETLSHQRETLQGPQSIQSVDLWLDAQGNIRKGEVTLLGKPMDMVACSEACAEAPTQNLNMLDSALVDSPRLITPEMLSDFLSYRVHVTNKAIIKPFINTDEQSVVDLGDGEWQINVYRGELDAQSPPTSADTQPNAWLQSDAPEIKQLASLAAGGAHNKSHIMGNLNAFVNRYLSARGLDIGYASALEVARDRRGDCAEYAVLLAALARAEGIPARVVVGMLYAKRYDNKQRVFVPHAWVVAWVHGRWQSFDPAVTHFDTGHIALDISDGNPWHFFNAANEFGSIQIDSIATFSEVFNATPASFSTGGVSVNGGGGAGRTR